MQFSKKCKNHHVWSFSAKKANFGQFLAKMAKMVKIFKKALGTFFTQLQALTNCKVSEKSHERFPRKRVTDERTHGRTDGRTYGRTDETPKVSTTSWSRDQKLDNSDVPIWRKVEKPPFFNNNFKRIKGD